MTPPPDNLNLVEDPSSPVEIIDRTKLDALLQQIETSALPERMKRTFTSKVRNTLDLRDISEYPDFIQTLNQQSHARNEILKSTYQQTNMPLWSGAIGAAGLPEEVDSEYLKWEYEYVAEFYKGGAPLLEIKEKMKARLGILEQEKAERIGQINKFFECRTRIKDQGVRFSRKLLSISNFERADKKKRDQILTKIAMKLEEVGELPDLQANLESPVINQLTAKKSEAEALRHPPPEGAGSPEKAWAIYDEMEKLIAPLRPTPGSKFAEWKAGVQLEKAAIEREVMGYCREVEHSLSSLTGPDLSPEQEGYLNSALARFSNFPGTLKIRKTIGPKIVKIELAILEKLQKSDASEEEIFRDPRAFLLSHQLDYEFIRRFLHQVAALAMAIGTNAKTQHRGQKELISEQSMNADTFAERQESHLVQFAAQEAGVTTEQVEAQADTGSVDTLSAIHEPTEGLEFQSQSPESLQVTTTDKAEEKHRVAHWEMTRISGFHPWPARDNERYLRQVLEEDQHMIFTNHYQVLKPSKAKRELKASLASRLHLIPGKSARARGTLHKTLNDLIDETSKGAKTFVREIFSHTNCQP